MDDPLSIAKQSLQTLLADSGVPKQVRDRLQPEYLAVSKLLERLDNEWIQIAAFGRVSVGKSALLNALLGEASFTTSPLHGETKQTQSQEWVSYQTSGVYLVDTPGINEVDGKAREAMSLEVANHSDLILFVVDGDMTQSETDALGLLVKASRPIILVLNKKDRYSTGELSELCEVLAQHSAGMIHSRYIVTVSADPALQWVIRVNDDGTETEEQRQPAPDIQALKQLLWDTLETEGKMLAALNASMFASDLTDQLGLAVIKARKEVGEKVIRAWCIGKGVAVAFNPVPVADLVAAVAVDVSLVMHLSKVYGLPLSRSEAGDLIKTIGQHMLLLMGTVWAVNLVSSALKFGTGGLSAMVTGGAQGVVAWYSTYVVGQAAEVYLAKGKSWGDAGPKRVVKDILKQLDRDSILREAKADIEQRLMRDH